jgi:hypothetical protein
MNALFLSPFFTSLQSSGLISQSLRISETSEQEIIFSTSNSGKTDRGILLQADDFRWRFEYTERRWVEWEGTVSVVWGQVGNGGGLKVEKMEVVVHEFKSMVFGCEEGWEWGLPDSVIDVLKVSL